MSDLIRDRIAQVMVEHRRVRAVDRTYECVCGVSVPTNSAQSLSRHQADVLLAEFPFLDGVTEEMVERAAAALSYELTKHAFSATSAQMQQELLEKAKKVLEAALGGETDV